MNSKTIIKLLFIALIWGSCAKPIGPSEDRPIFVYTDPIENPPDNFLILFNIMSVGQRFAEVTFADSSVWLIEKLGSPRYDLSISNLTDERTISSIDTLGLQANKKYRVIVHNVYNTEYMTFFVGFKKLDLDYSTFHRKF